MARIPIALQLYTVRDELAKDPAGTIKAVAAIGFEGVEANPPKGVSPKDFRKMVEDAGLVLIGGGVGVNELLENVDKVAADCRDMGITHLMTGIAGELRSANGDWRAVAELLKKACIAATEAGLTICYHNHAFEFESKVDGVYGFDYLFDVVGPEAMAAEIDVYWVHTGGEDPAAYIRKYAGRLPRLHIKDRAPAPHDQECPFAEVGHGILDWDAIFREAENAGVEWYVVEQDRCTRPPLESAKMSLEYLRSRGMLAKPLVL